MIEIIHILTKYCADESNPSDDILAGLLRLRDWVDERIEHLESDINARG